VLGERLVEQRAMPESAAELLRLDDSDRIDGEGDTDWRPEELPDVILETGGGLTMVRFLLSKLAVRPGRVDDLVVCGLAKRSDSILDATFGSVAIDTDDVEDGVTVLSGLGSDDGRGMLPLESAMPLLFILLFCNCTLRGLVRLTDGGRSFERN